MAIDNYRRFYAILRYMPPLYERDEQKKQLVLQYTNGRTDSLRDMTTKEYNAMCSALEREFGIRELRREKRGICLRLMQQLGKDTTDWSVVDEYCVDPRIAGKPFRELTNGELDTLARKLRAIKHRQDKKSSINQ